MRAGIFGGSRHSFRAGFLGTGVVKVASVALGAGSGVLLARILGAQGYGVYAYAMALVTLLAVPAQLGFPSLLIRNIAAYEVRGQWALMRGLLIRSNQVSLAFSLLLYGALSGGYWLLRGADDSESMSTILWGGMLLPLLTLGAMRGAALRGLRHVALGPFPEMVLKPALFILLLFVVPVFRPGLTLSPAVVMSTHVIAAAVTFGVGAFLLVRRLPAEMKEVRPKFDTRIWFASAIPLLAISALEIINAQIGVLFLGILAVPEDVGVYRATNAAADLVGFAYLAVGMAVAPSISRLFSQRNLSGIQHLMTKSARVSLCFALPVAALFIGFGGSVVGVVFGEEFRRGGVALGILSVGQIVNCATGAVVPLLNMTGFEKDTLKGFGLAITCNLLLDLFLIPIWNVEGAAFASATSLIVWNVFLVWLVYRRLGIDATALGIWKFQRQS